MNELFDIRKFEDYREDNRREVKKAKGGLPKSLWDTYSSFANTYGGVIILGIKELDDRSWETTGLSLKDKENLLDDFWSLINNRQKVSYNILSEKNIEVYEVKGDTIIVINVPMAARELRPIYINDDLFYGTFKRNHTGDFHCSKEQVKAMLRDQIETTADMNIVSAIPISDLDIETVHNYRNRHRIFKLGHPWIILSDEDYLQKIGAAEKGCDGVVHPTGAGLLMFGFEDRIVRYYPEYFLDYQEILDPHIRWTDRLQSSSGEWSGNLFEFYFRVYNKIIKNVKVPFKMVGGERVDDTPVHSALREVLANCLVNADFNVSRGIVIKQEKDVITIENPGTIRVGKYQMKCGGQSDPRNKALMKMFNLIGIGERAGSGVPELFNVWKNEGWKEPIIEERFDPDRTLVQIEFNEKTSDKKQTTKSTDKKQAIKASDKKQAIKASDKKQAIKASDKKQAIKASDKKQAIKASDKKQAIKASDKKQAIKAADKNQAIKENYKKLELKTIKNMDKIRDYLHLNQKSKTNEIAKYLDLSPERTRTILAEMKDIEAIGSNRNRFYQLIENIIQKNQVR